MSLLFRPIEDRLRAVHDLEICRQRRTPRSLLLTHVEAAAYLGIAVTTLYRYAEQERIECRKIGNRLEYRRASLDRFKEQQIRPARRPRARGTIASTLDPGN